MNKFKESIYCDLISREEIKRVLIESDTAGAEIDYTFLGFEEPYLYVKEHSKPSNVIIDFGCAYNPQCYLFKNYRKFIAVDLPFGNNVRFKTSNCDIYLMSAQEFIENMKDIDFENTIAICSYVPDQEAQQMIKDTFKYHYIQYCDEIISDTIKDIKRKD